jgi:NAD(P)-dependent dehydrogenase (short-subunit alcohol dehydrogenase family)
MSFTHTVLITGGTSGLGLQAALAVAQKHPEYLVVLASRTDPDSAAHSINNTLRQKNVTFLPLDLSSLANVRSFVQTWDTKGFPPIAALVFNAGVQFPEGLRKTDDGIESTFAINHVGHALLFHLIFPRLASEARIVVVSSGTHDPAQKSGLPDAKYTTAEELAHPTPDSAETNTGRQRYATSKLVNVLWAYALHQRLAKLPEKKLTVTAFDPGLVPGTGLAREASPILRAVWIYVLPNILPVLRCLISPNIHTARESGANLARLAVGDDVKGVSGVYYEGSKEIKSSKDSYDKAKQDDLWEWTLKNTAANKEEITKFEIGVN